MIIVADPDAAFLERAAAAIQRPDGLIRVSTLGEVEEIIAATPARVMVVVLGPRVSFDASLDFAEALERNPQAVAEVILVRDDAGPEALRAALRAGARDLLPTHFDEPELKDAVVRAEDVAHAHRPQEAFEGVQGKVVTIFSTKGGCGKSLVASNLAILLSQRTGQKVALVDLDLQSGDLAIMLQLLPALSIYEASQNHVRLDVEAIAGYLTPHRSGISLLAAPTEPSLSEAVTPAAVTHLLELLRSSFGYVVVDGPAFFTEQVLPALDSSDTIILVGSMDVPSVKNLRLALSTMHQLGVGQDKIHLVLNRADSKVGLRTGEVEKSLGAKIDVQIPSSRDVPLSINQGSPLATSSTRSPVIDAIAELLPIVSQGAVMADGSAPVAEPEPGGGGGFLSRRRK